MSRKIVKKIFMFAMAFFFVFYFYVQVKNIFIDAMETEHATVVTFDDTVELKCYIVRDETLINSTISGTYNYVISEGEKLASGQTITNIYSTDSEYKNQERIRELNSKIDVLNLLIIAVLPTYASPTKTTLYVALELIIIYLFFFYKK